MLVHLLIPDQAVTPTSEVWWHHSNLELYGFLTYDTWVRREDGPLLNFFISYAIIRWNGQEKEKSVKKKILSYVQRCERKIQISRPSLFHSV